jgi:hypothetical protein
VTKREGFVHITATRSSGATAADPNDFYPTPPRGTLALLLVEKFRGKIWEPACGDGMMSKVLEAAKYKVVSTDLVDRGYGVGGVDFLAQVKPRAPNVVTNPPFNLINQFVPKALGLTTGKVAILARLSFLEGTRRRAMFKSTPLARVWVFSSRLAIPHNRFRVDGYVNKDDRGGMIPFAWYVWEHGHEGQPTVDWLE